MKLCISTLACPGWDLQQIIDVCAANQIAGVDFRGLQNEIDVTKLPAFTGDGLDETLSRLRSRGIEIPCMNSGVALEAPAERWNDMLEETRRTCDICRRSGTRYLRVFGGAVPNEMTREEGRILAQRRLRQLAKMTRPAKVLILIETHDHWITFEQVNELLADTDPEEVGVLWDTEHTWRKGETPETTVARHGERLRHVHVKDSTPPPAGEKKSVPKLLGEGELPIGQFVKALTDAGYEGWYCLETEKRWHQAAPEPEVSIPQFAQYMRGLST
jgi:sugar phosphate isomerase/epimerase